MRKTFLAALALTGCVTPLHAEGPYIEGGLGLNILEPTDGYYQLAPDHPIPAYQNRKMPASTNYDRGWAAAVRAGYEWAMFRTDFEVAFTHNRIESTDFLSTNGVEDFWDTDPGAHGHAATLALLANGYLDLPTGTALTPYVGAGGGAALVTGYYENSLGGYVDAHVWAPAAQLVAGVAVAVTDRVSLIADYRFRTIFDVETRQEYSPPIPDIIEGGQLGAVAAGGTGNIYDHFFGVGFRASLN
jgi:opacity protein-like surface antigen